jgi:tripartite-type tricarboxylate transporter receptor subunit TctC
LEVNNWLGLVAPAQTPREIVARLNSEMNAMLATADLKGRIAALGNDPAGGTPEQMGDRIRKEVALWQKVFAKSRAR